eukprot:EG_transcript_29142
MHCTGQLPPAPSTALQFDWRKRTAAAAHSGFTARVPPVRSSRANLLARYCRWPAFLAPTVFFFLLLFLHCRKDRPCHVSHIFEPSLLFDRMCLTLGHWCHCSPITDIRHPTSGIRPPLFINVP